MSKEITNFDTSSDGNRASRGEILLYQTEDGESRIQVRMESGTVWLTQKLLADLYQKDVRTINEHIQNIFEEGEQSPKATIRKFRIVQMEGSRQVGRTVDFYNLDMILSVGYRVRSHRGTQFRQWATRQLREYLTKGFVLDDARLKEGNKLGPDYFDELLERIRDIRASEKRFYRKIRDIYKLSIDYDPEAEETREFFQTVQNKLHWAITGKTAAELIAERADADQANMGLTTWAGKKIRRDDVTVAKNYLNAEEISRLNRIVTMYLDYAEAQAERRQPLYMKDWKNKLDVFLRFNEYEILENAGQISMEVAQRLALEEYEKFYHKRLTAEAEAPDPDFDRIVKKIEEENR